LELKSTHNRNATKVKSSLNGTLTYRNRDEPTFGRDRHKALDAVASDFLLQLPHSGGIGGIALDTLKGVQIGHVYLIHHSLFISLSDLKVNGKDINGLASDWT
jgi:hypothetical protein